MSNRRNKLSMLQEIYRECEEADERKRRLKMVGELLLAAVFVAVLVTLALLMACAV